MCNSMPSRDSAAEYILIGMLTSPNDIDPVQIARILKDSVFCLS
jgi:hypothetical protein